MIVHFVYYNYDRLHEEEVFYKNYWNELQFVTNDSYLREMLSCLDYAIRQEDYCLPLINSPMKEIYPEEDIRLFFEKFHVFLLHN